MRKSAQIALVLGAIGLSAAGALYFLRPGALPQNKATAQLDASTQLINKGEYLARLGDCIACHTEPNGPAFAGGRAMPTPFGALYVPNITPDDETGIGLYTADEFYRMMHQGVTRHGDLMYPAMPYPSYTQVTREDSDAI